MLSAARGNAAEAAILASLIMHGYHVLVPFGDGQPYDLVADLQGPLLRVQCKRAWHRNGCLIFNSRSTDHGRGPQLYVGRADIFGVYFPPADQVFLVPLDEVGMGKACLRLEPAR